MIGSRGLQAMVEISVAGMACVVVLSCSNEQPGRGETAQGEAAATRPASDGASPEPQPEARPQPAGVAVDNQTISPANIPDACRYDDLPGALAAAKARWQGTGINSYSMTIQRASFRQLPVWPNSTPLKLTVRDGRASGNIKGVDSTWLQSLTVDGLFQYIESQLALHPDCFKVQFDPMFGYPTSIRIDPEFGGADDELEYAITDFGP
jgi:hypothetical protein